MASFRSFLGTFMVFMAYYSSQVMSSQQLHASQFSTISASPAYLPSSPSPVASAPALSPDITPLFPTPRGMAPSPAESSLPTIPSSRSPPNPDNFLAPSPDQLAVSPSRSLPVSSSVSLVSRGPLNVAVFIGFLMFCLKQLDCM